MGHPWILPPSFPWPLVKSSLESTIYSTFKMYPKSVPCFSIPTVTLLFLFSLSVVSDSFWHHEPQHARLPCPSPSPRVCSNSCPLNWLMPSNHLILYHPLLLLPSTFPSIRVFSSESALCIRWPKYWSFSISPTNEYSRLISLKMDWFDLLAVSHGYPLFGVFLCLLFICLSSSSSCPPRRKTGKILFF